MKLTGNRSETHVCLTTFIRPSPSASNWVRHVCKSDPEKKNVRSNCSRNGRYTAISARFGLRGRTIAMERFGCVVTSFSLSAHCKIAHLGPVPHHPNRTDITEGTAFLCDTSGFLQVTCGRVKLRPRHHPGN